MAELQSPPPRFLDALLGTSPEEEEDDRRLREMEIDDMTHGQGHLEVSYKDLLFTWEGDYESQNWAQEQLDKALAKIKEIELTRIQMESLGKEKEQDHG